MPGNQIGIRTMSIIPTGVTATSNTVLAAVPGMTFAVLANTTWQLVFNIPLSTGGTGGAKFQIVAPSVTFYLVNWALYLAGSPGTLADTAVQTSSAAFSNALASAANHYMTATCCLKTSAAGTIGLQFAQLSSNATPLTLLQGGVMQCYQL